MTKYKVTLRQNVPTVEVEAENVHVSVQGHIKFLNGEGRHAVLVAFFNPADVISVVKVN